MSGYVVHDASTGEARSIATIAPDRTPAGCAVKTISDADYKAVTAGASRWDPPTRAVVVDTARANADTNAQVLRDRLSAYLALPSPSAANTTKAVRALVRVALSLLDDVSDTA